MVRATLYLLTDSTESLTLFTLLDPTGSLRLLFTYSLATPRQPPFTLWQLPDSHSIHQFKRSAELLYTIPNGVWTYKTLVVSTTGA
jgi:hypothetical protein